MPYVGKAPISGGFHKLDNLTASATDTYALTLGSAAYYPETANQLLVSLNGVIQAPQDSFTVSGSNLVFDSALTSSDSIDFVVALGDVLGVGSVTDGAVTTNKIGNNAVTSAKLDTNIDIAGTLDSTGVITADAGIKLGGTASENLLDNYYEGTWSPYFSDINGSPIFNEAPTVHFATYQRIGDFVTLHTWFQNAGGVSTTAAWGATSFTYIGGLPFAVPSNRFYGGVVSFQQYLSGGYDASSAAVPLSVLAEGGYQVLRLSYAVTAGTTQLQNQFVNQNTTIVLAITYKVT